MICLKSLKGRRVGVLGFGYTGKAVVDSLLAGGAQVFLYDDNGVKDEKYQKYSANLLDEEVVQSLGAIIMSPGIHLFWPAPHPTVVLARKYGIDLIGDLDLFQRSIQKTKAKIIGITGTNGKSTTTALIHHILSSSGVNSCIGGNFGPPFLSLNDDSDFYVFELSSYQLEHAKLLGFDTAILLNITPDHLTRHGGMAGYIAAKQKIFVNSKKSIIALDDDHCAEIFEFLRTTNRQNLIPISGKMVPDNGVGWDNDCLVDNRFCKAEVICQKYPNLDGNHNRQNIAAAYAACCDTVSREDFVRNLYAFQCLEHRQEFVANVDGIPYINDSKATNVDSVEQALLRFNNIFWILGGRPKEGGIASLKKYFSKVKQAFLIGEAAEDWYAFLSSQGVVCEIDVTLEKAVKRAREEVQKSLNLENLASNSKPDIVLLSPACASFDQFKSFEERGDVFKALVHEMEKS